MSNQQRKNPMETDTLYVYNIPENKNKIPLLFKHFKKYGHIKSIWCSGKVAAIGYTTVEEAVTAYHSPDAYQNNRFVFIKYHRNPKEAECLLSLAADMDKVKAVTDEVKAKIEEKQKLEEENMNKIKHIQKIAEIDEKITSFVQTQQDLEKMAENILKKLEKEQNPDKQNTYKGQFKDVKKIIDENNENIKELARKKELLEAEMPE